MEKPRITTLGIGRLRKAGIMAVLAPFSLLVLLAANESGKDGFREWNDLHDRRFEAKLLSVSEESVRLANREGKEIDFPFDDLSSVDRKYAELWERAGGDLSRVGQPSEFREWKNSSGGTFEARLIDIGERVIKIQNKEGKQAVVGIENLSPEDRSHVHEWDTIGKSLRAKRAIPPRRWTDDQGRYFDAQLVDAASKTVKFENKDGKQIVYLIADLSRDDRFFLERLSRGDRIDGPKGPGVVPDLDDPATIGSKLAKLHSSDPEFFAVLINGDTSTLHKSNLLNAFETLRKMGHDDDHIIVLSSNFAPSSSYGRSSRSINAGANAGNIRTVMGGLREVCSPEDTVFVYTTGHGGFHPKAGAYLALENKSGYSAQEFGKSVGELKGKFISVMDQCYSGAMVEAIPASRTNTIAISAAPPDKKTFCKYFTQVFWFSIQNLQFDLDRDGVVSIREAFSLAMREHKRRVNWTSTDGMIHSQPKNAVLMPKLR